MNFHINTGDEMDYSWKLTVYKSWDEVDDPAFIDQWQKLMRRSPNAHVFFHPVLLKAWTDACRSIYDLKPVYCTAESVGITFFLPLVIWKRNWKNAFVRMLVPAGYPDYDYHDPIVTACVSKEMMDSFWMLIRNTLLKNTEIAFDEALLCGMHSAAGLDGWGENDVCPYIDLRRYADFPSFFGSLRKSYRKDIERQKKRLSESGRLQFRVFEPHESIKALASLPAFLDAHRRKWPHAFKPEGFHERLVREALPEGILHFSEIQLDGKPISWHFGFRYNRHFYYYMPTFLEEFGAYSPGKLHLAALLEDAYRQGTEIFDFLRGSESYKKEWANAEEPLYGYLFFASGVAGRVRVFVNDTLITLRNGMYITIFSCVSEGAIAPDSLVYAPSLIGL